MNGFEDFDVTQEPGQGQMMQSGEGFEDFDPVQEPGEAAPTTIEALGGLAENEDQLRSLTQARDELERRLMTAPGEMALAAAEEGPAGFGNIVGVGIGEKEVGGAPIGQPAVTVFVREKLSSSKVAGETLVPETVGGVPTDVVVTGEISAHPFRGKYRPAPGGVSIGPCTVALAGTLGCLVTRGGQLFIISNNHVIATVNRGPIGVGIAQPGRADGGICPRDIIARLTQFVPIVFGTTCNFVDAAIAQTSPSLVDRRILRSGGVRVPLRPPVVPPALNRQVQKSGRTTQHRRGLISTINVTVNVNYSPFGGVARFCGQFVVRGIGGTFSDRGDSGSLITTFPANNPVGLLFAGNAANNVTIGNDIRQVLARLGVSIVF